MFPFWVPLSSVTIGAPPLPVTAFVLRRMLARGGPVSLSYWGDRMHPCVRHGQAVEVRPLDGAPGPGAVVLALPGNIPDLLRVVETGPDRVVLAGDADPSPPITVRPEEVLALADLARRRPAALRRVLRRLRLDLREARAAWIDRADDPAQTVLRKYEEQAPTYARGTSRSGIWPLEDRVRRAVPAGGRILVVGSGTGFECFRLEQCGLDVRGIDFAPRMVAIAREQAAERGSAVRFAEADLRSHREPAASLDAVVFTFDVYSFIPGRETRVAMMSRLREWLRPGGVIYLSARRVAGLYGRAILTWSLLSRMGPAGRVFGDTHTRWLALDGTVRRSFVKCFTPRALAAEIRNAGLEAGPWEAGHAELRAVAGAPAAPGRGQGPAITRPSGGTPAASAGSDAAR